MGAANPGESHQPATKAQRPKIPKSGSSLATAFAKAAPGLAKKYPAKHSPRNGTKKKTARRKPAKGAHATVPPFRDELEERHAFHPAAFSPRGRVAGTAHARKPAAPDPFQDPSPPSRAPSEHQWGCDEADEADGEEAAGRDWPALRAGAGGRRGKPPKKPLWTRLAVAAAAIAFFLGFAIPRGDPKAVERETPLATQQEAEAIDEAVLLLHAGDHSQALDKLSAIAARNPDVPALEYLQALASFESGDLRAAYRFAKSSADKGQRTGASLVLQSMAEAAGSGAEGLRDPGVIREALLRRALQADPADPFPMVELANLLREKNREDDALAMFKSAAARLHPVDTHAAVETTISLMELKRTPDAKLPKPVSDGTLPEMFASAYVCLRLGHPDQAEAVLDACRKRSSPGLFDYISNDPVFLVYSNPRSAGTGM